MNVLHLRRPEELKARGMPHKKAQLVIDAYPVVVLSNEWLEELFCPQCCSSNWCQVVKHHHVLHSVSWAPPELWQQVAHGDPLAPNTCVSQLSRRAARRTDGRRLFDSGTAEPPVQPGVGYGGVELMPEQDQIALSLVLISLVIAKAAAMQGVLLAAVDRRKQSKRRGLPQERAKDAT